MSEEWLDDESGPEWSESDQWDGDWDDDESVTVTCASCGADVYEEAEQCPSCGEWITRFHSPWQGHSPWWVILGVLGVLATILALVGV
tara:strand:+ start:743 stop:1006 length:264 start_codon:yes stop_codon:yes gene_type:complete